MRTMNISLGEARNKIGQAAYIWAIEEQRRLGCVAEPLRLSFESDCLDADKDGCIISIFYDRETGKTLLRRDWLEDMGIRYDILVNFEEARKNAPRSVAHMLENGVKLYRYYDGPNGGVTRRVDKKWH